MKSNLDRPLDSSAVMHQNAQRDQQRARQAMYGRVGMQMQAQYSQLQQAAHGATPAVHTDTIYAVCNQRPTAMTSGAFTASGMDYVAVGQVESFPVIGSKRSSNVFTPIRGSKTKGKGSSDYGGGDMVMADLPTDAGQVILKAIEAQSEGGSMKITYGDGEVHYIYFHAMSWQLSQAQEGAFMKRTCEIQVLDTVVVVAA